MNTHRSAANTPNPFEEAADEMLAAYADEEVLPLHIAEPVSLGGLVAASTKYEFHAVTNDYSKMTTEEFEGLKRSVQANGFYPQNPIWIINGNQIIDGKHRYLACRELGITPVFKVYEGSDPKQFVHHQNQTRRHRSTSQKAMEAARMANAESGVRTDLGPSANSHEVATVITLQDAADLFSIGRRAVAEARAVLKSGRKDLIAFIENDEMSVHAAYEQIKSISDTTKKPKSLPAPGPTKPTTKTPDPVIDIEEGTGFWSVDDEDGDESPNPFTEGFTNSPPRAPAAKPDPKGEEDDVFSGIKYDRSKIDPTKITNTATGKSVGWKPSEDDKWSSVQSFMYNVIKGDLPKDFSNVGEKLPHITKQHALDLIDFLNTIIEDLPEQYQI